MNRRLKQALEQLAQENGLKLDAKSETVYGVKNGYSVCLSSVGQTNQLDLAFSIIRDGEPPAPKELQRAVKKVRGLGRCVIQGYNVHFNVRGGMTTERTRERILNALDAVTEVLRTNGYDNCCQICGTVEPTAAYVVGGGPELLCPVCYATFSQDFGQPVKNRKDDNLPAGFAGALLGSALGAAVMVLIGQLGYVAISGVIIAVCTLKGYERLSGRLSVRGIVISIALMLGMIYLGNRVDWAVGMASYYKVDLLTAFHAISYLLSQGYIAPGTFYGHLASVYVFAILGAAPFIVHAVRGRNLESKSYRMGKED